jgi:hypothetical protein
VPRREAEGMRKLHRDFRAVDLYGVHSILDGPSCLGRTRILLSRSITSSDYRSATAAPPQWMAKTDFGDATSYNAAEASTEVVST